MNMQNVQPENGSNSVAKDATISILKEENKILKDQLHKLSDVNSLYLELVEKDKIISGYKDRLQKYHDLSSYETIEEFWDDTESKEELLRTIKGLKSEIVDLSETYGNINIEDIESQKNFMKFVYSQIILILDEAKNKDNTLIKMYCESILNYYKQLND